MKNLIKLLIICVFPVLVKAQIPAGYYDSAAGLTGESLKLALHNIIDNHTVINYSDLYSKFDRTDLKPNGKIWDIYSDNPSGTPAYEYTFGADECGNYNSEGDCYNKEHSWPKSWFGGEVYPMYSDLFIIYPTDGYVNSMRSNYPYGEVSSPTWTSTNGSKLGPCSVSGYSQTVFEPIDEYKGDLARTYFYVAVRYLNEDSSWPGSDMTTGAELKPWAFAMIYQWHINDPVSQKEINRNDSIYKIQNNRNPFIDHPEWVDSVWFPSYINKISNDFNTIIFPNPASNKISVFAEKKMLRIQLLNQYGEIIENLKVDEQEFSKDISELPIGVYFMKIFFSDSTQIKSVVKL
ncbi:MAG: hypothetical protein Kow0068_15230 [Marinilabiliales bacterium]